MKTNRLFLLVILFVPLSALAIPPFVYESALKWSDETVKSPIPAGERIYFLGPEKISEPYLVNDNQPATHIVEVRRTLAANGSLTLGSALKDPNFDHSKQFHVAVYCKTDLNTLNASVPYFRAEEKEAMAANLPLHPRDVVWIVYDPPPGMILTP